MKRSLFHGLLAAVVLALGLFLYQRLFPNEERRLLRLLDDLAAAASIPAGEKDLTRLNKAARLAGFFTTDTEITVDLGPWQGRVIHGRDELLQLVLSARANAGEVQVQFVDPNITVDEDAATVHATGFARVAGQSDPHVQELKLHFIRSGGPWKIHRVESIRTLRP